MRFMHAGPPDRIVVWIARAERLRREADAAARNNLPSSVVEALEDEAGVAERDACRIAAAVLFDERGLRDRDQVHFMDWGTDVPGVVAAIGFSSVMRDGEEVDNLADWSFAWADGWSVERAVGLWDEFSDEGDDGEPVVVVGRVRVWAHSQMDRL